MINLTEDRSEKEKNYYEIETIDKLCPLLSVVEMKQFGQLFYCVGEKCMWWKRICQSIEEPKTGEWVEVNSYESEHHSVTDMRCNICGKYSSVVLPHKTRFTYPYCPNCGAKIERSKE